MDFFKKPLIKNGKFLEKKKIDFDRPSLLNESTRKTDHKSSLATINSTSLDDVSQDSTVGATRQLGRSCLADDEYDDNNSVDSHSSVSSVTQMEKVKVHLRVKPVQDQPAAYKFYEDEVIVKVAQQNNNNKLGMQTEKQFKFTSIIGAESSQYDVYEECVKPVLSIPFNSSGASFCGYGVSNSGKTYTILGEKSAGIVPRALSQIFTEYQSCIAQHPCIRVHNDQIEPLNDDEVEYAQLTTSKLLEECRKKKIVNNWANVHDEHDFEPKSLENDLQVHVWISFLEIYNEKMTDLFKDPSNTFLAKTTLQRGLRIISNGGFSYVHGLTWLPVKNYSEAIMLLQYGLKKVNYASTGINSHSSRSHTVFTINLIKDNSIQYEYSSLKFCDLAGAERQNKTGNVGDRLKEASGINTSLLVLGRCLEAVLHNQKVGSKKELVPTRDSKLTHLLQSSLTGREKFVMIVNLMPTIEFLEENLNVLNFGSIACKIVTKKTETKKYSTSTRYSYFMKNVVNSPKLNSSLIGEESAILDESALDISYSQPSYDELMHLYAKKKLECQSLYDFIARQQKEFNQRENVIRQEIVECSNEAKKIERQYMEDEKRNLTYYYDKKMDNLRKVMERKEREFNDEIGYLMDENVRLRKKLGLPIDEEVDLTEEEDEEDCSVIEDVEEVNGN